jgi:glycosyltransferase involved in cell wall biosynthesis
MTGARTLRILHVIASDRLRGAELFASDLVGALLSQGIDQQVALLRRSNGAHVQYQAPVTSLGDSWQLPGLRVGLQAVASLRRLIDTWHPSVVQAHGGEAFKYAVLASVGRPTQVVYRRIGAAPPWITRGPRRAAYAVMLRRAACIVAVAEAVRSETVNLFGVRNVITIPNAVDSQRLRSEKGREATRRLIGIDSSSSVLLSLGALTWEKNPLAHLDVAGRIIAMHPRVVHLIAGDGPMREEVREAIRLRGLEGRAIMLGARSDVTDLLAASDVMLFASRPDGMEGMPAVLIEAGMMGVPVAGYDIVGASEVVVHNSTGLLSAYGNVETLSSNALQLLRDPRLRRSMGNAAQARCRSSFDIGTVASEYLATYQRVSAA